MFFFSPRGSAGVATPSICGLWKCDFQGFLIFPVLPFLVFGLPCFFSCLDSLYFWAFFPSFPEILGVRKNPCFFVERTGLGSVRVGAGHNLKVREPWRRFKLRKGAYCTKQTFLQRRGLPCAVVVRHPLVLESQSRANQGSVPRVLQGAPQRGGAISLHFCGSPYPSFRAAKWAFSTLRLAPP